ncbi:MAG: hypothetical protein U5R49_23255 [Deltaproteobacteria bacterium]|nr:hypothetical protein [Deltaproteobacteria bacterium]
MKKHMLFGKKAGIFGMAGLALLLIFGIVPAKAESTQFGVIATAAADYSSSAISIITVDPKTGGRAVLNNQLASATSDITVDAFGPYYYRLGRFMADNVTKVAVTAPNTPIWQYSTNDPSESTSSNPYQMVFVNSEKAYLMRYGSTKAWIVNPSTTTEAGFKIGELDLSSYADADGLPGDDRGRHRERQVLHRPSAVGHLVLPDQHRLCGCV